MKTSDFDFDVPGHLIAQHPLPERIQSRMMLVRHDSGKNEDWSFGNFPEFVEKGDVVVINNTRVFPARIFGRRDDTGGKIEILLLEELGSGGKAPEGGAGHQAVWQALYKGRGKAGPGIKLNLAGGLLEGYIEDVPADGSIVLRLVSDKPVHDAIEKCGRIPLPPYIKRNYGGTEWEAADRERYQTVYAKEEGSVAAPTAGLHFTETMLAGLKEKGVGIVEVTLHVGWGTFAPVKLEKVEDHRMHEECYRVGKTAADAINSAKQAGKKVIAVGTTTVRALESVFARHGGIVPDSGRTKLFIYPPYRFGVIDGLLTNFHLPRSTLLMMVSAFTGRETIEKAYKDAIAREYRFFSYGDCMLIV